MPFLFRSEISFLQHAYNEPKQFFLDEIFDLPAGTLRGNEKLEELTNWIPLP